MRVIGICRFSYPALGGFRRMHDSIEDREAYLYQSSRMDLRFRHFETLTLPSIAAQSDPDFTFLILVGESLPEIWRSRLETLIAPVPQIRLVASPPMKHRLAMQLAIQEELGSNTTDSLQFRLDDDDAVNLNFVRRSRKLMGRSERIHRHARNMAVEFNSGHSVILSAQGIRAAPVTAGFWACGLAVLFRAGDPKTVMNFAHHKLHHEMPTLIHPDPDMFLRAKHDDNDSGDKFDPGELEPLTDDKRALFRSAFNVDESRVKEVFGAPAVPPGKG
ncbi:riboflavin synthase subunit beta [Roseovarius sp. TE539]|uniref:glycosyltransferase n=1 Tax=Roseovarius sp. TE539 TaxID=2249812 RepID=UPI000DE0CD8B|nr:glycosyltransferase [Roseovarius sp. TE539]RBI75854.1 riboflavin synthase subunit beta [Roseovarius sp. TE539]